VLLAVAAGLWAAGIVGGPRLPEVAPYELTLDRGEAGALAAAGHVPSDEVRQALSGRAAAEGGTADLALARGPIAPSWGADVLALVDILDALDTYSVALSGDTARVTGTGAERAAVDAVRAALAPGLPGALTGTVDIAYTPPFLAVEPLRAILGEFADCGPLALVEPPATGYGPGQAVAVTGSVAAPATREALRETLLAAASPRPVEIEAQVLNEALCKIEPHLPDAPPGGLTFRFSEGEAPGQEAGDTFLVGENPVIDVVLPADVTDGYLSVSFLDVSGNVFHLLPNLNRPDNAVASLREGRDGAVTVRLSYPLNEAEGTGQLAFRVDDRALGTSKIVAIRSTAPLFDSMRPTTESGPGYVQALTDGQRNGEARVTSLDTRLFVTAEN
jgi:serine/threonine-protein kinase